MNNSPASGYHYVQNPKLSPASPRLSDTVRPFTSRLKCQRCGQAGPNVSGWIEHDHNDKPEPIYIFLCKGCADLLIEPHPRLYNQIMPHEPWPGIMDICADCPWRKLSRCTSPLAKFNGGVERLKIDIEPPSMAHLYYGRGRGEWRKLYHSPATNCSGKTTPLPFPQ